MEWFAEEFNIRIIAASFHHIQTDGVKLYCGNCYLSSRYPLFDTATYHNISNIVYGGIIGFMPKYSLSHNVTPLSSAFRRVYCIDNFFF